MDAVLKREMILEHYQNPVHHGLIESDEYQMYHTNNESCIDHLDIQYKIVDGIIEDIRFSGEACAISTSATSVMIERLLGCSVEEARKVLENYENMIEEREYEQEVLKDLNIYEETYLQPNRKKCAIVPFVSLKEALDSENQK